MKTIWFRPQLRRRKFSRISKQQHPFWYSSILLNVRSNQVFIAYIDVCKLHGNMHSIISLHVRLKPRLQRRSYEAH